MSFTTENTYTGNGTTTKYSFSFPYIISSDIKVTVDDANGVPIPTTVSIADPTTIQFTTPPANGRKVRIFRQTAVDNVQTQFFPGAAIRADDLNLNALQVLYKAQEVDERALTKEGGIVEGDIEFKDADLVFDGTTADNNKTRLSVVDPTTNQTYRLPNIATGGDHTLISNGDTGTVTSAMIANGTIVNDDISESAEIAVSKLADGAARQVLQTAADGTTVEWTNDVDLPGNLDVTGNLTVDGNTTLGNASADTITPTARIAGNLIPSSDNSHDLGSSTLEWKDLHLDGTANIDSLVADTADINGGTVDNAVIGSNAAAAGTFTDLSVTGNVDLGNASTDTITVTGRLDSDVLPIADNTHDLGSSTLKFAEVHATTFTGALSGNADTATDLAAAAKVTNTEQSNHTVDDSTYFTTSASDDRYFRQDSTETIASSVAWTGSDNFVATTGAIDARIIDLVDDVGGFVPIANETSFPTSNPDINSPATGGTIVSIKEISTDLVPSSGSVTIANGRGSGLPVVINGLGTTTLPAGFGALLETTATDHTYTFHRLTPKATEVTTVAGVAADITTVANNVTDINNFADVYQINGSEPTTRADSSALQEGDLCYRTDLDVIQVFDGTNYSNITPDQATINDITIVADDLASFEDLGSVADSLVPAQSGGALETCADNIADIRTLADIEDGTTATNAIQTVAGISADVTTVAGKATEIGRLGTADAVADMAILGTTDVVADLNTLGTADVVADMNTLATTANVANMNTCSNDISNINTVAGSIANVNATAGSISNVNTVAGSIADVNRYANEYTISASQPASPSEGDLWYDDTNNELKFFNGTTFNAISAGISSIADDTSPEISTSASQLDMNSKNITEVGTISGNNMALDFGSVTDS